MPSPSRAAIAAAAQRIAPHLLQTPVLRVSGLPAIHASLA